MMKHWTVFEGRPNGAARGLPRVTLAPNSTILLNEPLWIRMGRPEAVELMFDAPNRLIGMRRTDPKRTNAFPLKKKARSSYHTISAGAFLQHFGIRVERTTLLAPVEVETGGLASCGMSQAINVGRGSR
ncbi:MAG: hypothetical protein KBD94_01020 [Pyrinomonadaceae bacterium]|nr:hypothetical protein [Pyrinomonadaceae bacterium]